MIVSALSCGLLGEALCVYDQCYTEDGWDFSNYDIDKTATALVSSGAAGAAGCAIAFCAGGIAIEVGRELAAQLGVQAGTRMFAAISSGIGGALVGSVSGAGARMAEALTYNAVCDLIGCPEYKMSFYDRIAYSWNPDAICEDALMGFCTYAASAAYLYRPANNQGISVSEGAHCYDNSGSAAETAGVGKGGTNSVDTPIKSGVSQPRDVASSNSIYEQINPDGTVKSRAFYDENGRQFSRQDFDHRHFDKKTKQYYQPHEHNYYYNKNGQPIGKSDGPLPSGYTNMLTK